MHVLNFKFNKTGIKTHLEQIFIFNEGNVDQVAFNVQKIGSVNIRF